MQLKNIFFKILLIGFILILCTDIIVHIWFAKDFDLLFDSAIFNNVVTPVFTIVSVVIYSFALFITIAQNKIILSQNIKPFFEKEIEKLLIKGKEIDIESILFENEKINALNYTQYINKTFLLLSKNKEYIEDYNRLSKLCTENTEYFKNRSYIKEILFLNDFAIGIGPIYFFYNDIIELIGEINSSKLIDEDKELLKKQIKRTFLLEYIALNNIQNKHNHLMLPIPLIFNSWQKDIEYKQLAETRFSQHLKFFNEEL